MKPQAAFQTLSVSYGIQYRGADKSLAWPERKQAKSVKSVMSRGMDWFG